MTKPVIITKQMIDDAAVSMVKKSGLDALTARNIASKLHCSTQPIYKTYANMDELRKSTVSTLADYVIQRIVTYRKTGCAYLDSGLGYIHFAGTERVLFQLFCISDKNHHLLHINIENDTIRALMEQEVAHLPLSILKKDKIFLKTMIFTHGLAVLAYGAQLKRTEDEIAILLQEAFESYITQEMEEKNCAYSSSWRQS